MNIIYFLIRLFNKFISYLFYREFEAIDIKNLPKEGPVLLFCNHNNCYVDGVVNIFSISLSLMSSLDQFRSSHQLLPTKLLLLFPTCLRLVVGFL